MCVGGGCLYLIRLLVLGVSKLYDVCEAYCLVIKGMS